MIVRRASAFLIFPAVLILGCSSLPNLIPIVEDFDINVVDIIASVNGFTGQPYPFGTGQCGTATLGFCNGGANHNSPCVNDSDCNSDPCATALGRGASGVMFGQD